MKIFLFFKRSMVLLICIFITAGLLAQQENSDYLTEIENKLQRFGKVEKICESIDDFKAGSSPIIDVDHPKFSKAIQVNIESAGKNPYDITLRSKENQSELFVNDYVIASFYVRCLESDNTGLGKLNAIIEQTPAWFGFGAWESEFDQEWTYVSIIAKITHELNDNKVCLSIHLADRKQLIEFGGLTFHLLRNTDNGIDELELKKAISKPIKYKGMEADAAWRVAANKRIEDIRKVDFSIKISEEKNKTLKNVPVKIELVNHEFGFGTFLGSLGEEELNKWGEEKFNRYLNTSKEYFNRYTVPMYWAIWASWGWPEKKFEEDFKYGLEWATRSGYDTRGHVPLWMSYKLKPFFKEFEDNPDLIEAKIEEHLDFVFQHERVNGKLTDWDLINEVYNNHEIIDLLEDGEYSITKWFERAQKLDENANFFINDFGILNQDKKHQQGYSDLLQRMIERNTPFDGLGMQGHINGAIPPETILETYDRFAVFNKPIHVTELDFIFDFPEDNARYMEDFLTASFSHPALEAVIVWGYWKPAKGSWRPNFWFFDADFNEHEVSKAWKRMTQEVWHTELSEVTNRKGVVSGRGFKGQYLIHTNLNGKPEPFALSLSSEETQFEISEKLILKPGIVISDSKETVELKFNIDKAGNYQIGVNGELKGDMQPWYTPNFEVSTAKGEIIKLDLIDQQNGVSDIGRHFDNGTITLKINWNKFEAANDKDAEFQLNRVYLIKVIN